MAQPHVVIVGGGFGGLAAAKALASQPVRVTLVDKRNHHLFQPLLYQVATAALAPSDIAEPLRGVLGRARNVEVRLGEVVDVDVLARTVTLADGDALPWDKLIVAAGARTTWFGHDDWAEHAPGLKSLGDALDIRHRILRAFEEAEWTEDAALRARLLTFVVVGAGPTGVEMAGAIREIACHTLAGDFRHVRPSSTRVVLVEAGPRVLAALPAPLSTAAQRFLEELGVEVRLGQQVEAMGPDGVIVAGERIDAGTVVWAAGVAPSPLAARLGAAVDRRGRVIVAADGSLPDHPDVFAVGDLAHHAHDDPDHPLPGVAPVAIAMGHHAARCILGDLRGRARAPLHYFDKGDLATVGRRRAVARVGPLRMAGTLAWLAWVFVHLMTLVGHRNRVVVFTKWAWAWSTWERSSRLVWQDEPEGATEPAARVLRA